MSGKKINWYKLLLLVILLLILGMLIYQLAFAREKDFKLISKGATLVVTYALAIAGIRLSPRSRMFLYQRYAEQYQDILRDAFSQDKKSYRRLMQAIEAYNRDDFAKSRTILDILSEQCVTSRDTSAVLLFRALCDTEDHRPEQAIKTYEQLLKTDETNARAWSNLGLLYTESDRNEEAMAAYRKAITCDSHSAYAYTNLAALCIKLGQTSDAIEHAKHALAIDSTMYQAAYLAAQACAELGDQAQAAVYVKQFAAHANPDSISDPRARILLSHIKKDS